MNLNSDDFALSRRRFLQAAVAVGGATALLPSWMQDMAANATPLGPAEGVLVLVMMPGGNDGLNMVPPISNSAYYSKRPTVNIPASAALPIGHGLGLHPALTNVKGYFDNGKAAIVQGVGMPGIVDLSHFSSMARWMAGSTSTVESGWLGRFLDAKGGDPLLAVNIGSSTPAFLVGSHSRATALPLSINGAFGVDQTNDYDRRQYSAVREYAATPTGLGAFGDELARMGRNTVDLGGRVRTAFGALETASIPVKKMALAARLINLDLGIRVIGVELADFDHHQSHLATHQLRMAELNDGLGAFFSNLSIAFENRVTVMTFSEFGRRVAQNGSGGTDHGAASNMLIVGNRVRGGLYGTTPSLTRLDSTDNMFPAVSFMSTYATVLDSWLGVESSSILGGRFENLGYFDGVGDAPGLGNGVGAGFGAAGVGDPTVDAFANPSAASGYWLTTSAGAVYRFGNAPSVGNAGKGAPVAATMATPSSGGVFVARVDGEVVALGDATHRGDMAGSPLNKPIVGMAVTRSGNGYWLLGGDGGIFCFGDAGFYGSTGAMNLNKPVVGMAATPTGRGYWLVASDGGIFCFGDAPFLGSMGGTKLNKPVVGMACTASGNGYWLVASDGGIFSFGDAAFFGSTGALALQQPIVGMTVTVTGSGYLFVASDGGVFCFGDAQFQGSLGAARLASPVVGVAS